jgi:hypothetical protein
LKTLRGGGTRCGHPHREAGIEPNRQIDHRAIRDADDASVKAGRDVVGVPLDGGGPVQDLVAMTIDERVHVGCPHVLSRDHSHDGSGHDRRTREAQTPTRRDVALEPHVTPTTSREESDPRRMLVRQLVDIEPRSISRAHTHSDMNSDRHGQHVESRTEIRR